MITIIPIEPLSDEHAFLVIEAFNRHFIDGGGQMDGDGYGCGGGMSNGDGWGDGGGWMQPCIGGGKCPEEWRTK